MPTSITTLDLTHEYWQIALAEDSKAKTAYMTLTSKYQFESMPFVLGGTPATFQRYMYTILADMTGFAVPMITSGHWTISGQIAQNSCLDKMSCQKTVASSKKRPVSTTTTTSRVASQEPTGLLS